MTIAEKIVIRRTFRQALEALQSIETPTLKQRKAIKSLAHALELV